MSDPFISSVLQLRTASLESLVEKLHAVFSEISTMGPEAVVAAYQTVSTVAIEGGHEDEPMMRRIGIALLHRMDAILYLEGSSRHYKMGSDTLRKWFMSVVGQNLDIEHTTNPFKQAA